MEGLLERGILRKEEGMENGRNGDGGLGTVRESETEERAANGQREERI